MNDGSIYRAVWRWHFYAGLIILPLLVWMATTGGLYLYKNEIERSLYRPLIELPASVKPMPVADIIRSVERQSGAQVVQVSRPAGDQESWRLIVRAEAGEKQVFVRPDDARILGTTQVGGPVEVIKQLHSLSIAGWIANLLTEIVAGWAIVLVLTGFYLWWPRGGNKALSLAGQVGERKFWRNFHASTGSLVGVIILFLAVTGMPWTTLWGGQFHAFVAAEGIGRPAAPATVASEHEEHLPWSLRGRHSPRAAGHGDLGPDVAIAAARTRGLKAPWVLDLPQETGQPYRVSPAIDHAQDARVLYVEPSTGRVLQDNAWPQFGAGAKAFEWGIYTHQGQEYGEANRLIMLAGCIGVWLLALSAPIMWWKRRRNGHLHSPPRAIDRRRARGVIWIMLVIGVIFPLTGMTMLLALSSETVWKQVRRSIPS